MAGDSTSERKAVFAACTRFLNGHGPRRPKQALLAAADAAAATESADIYGAGPLIESFEAEVAELLGKPAAVFMPSGTMAQPIALRIYADRSGCHTVAFHPTCHLELHEQRGYGHLHGLQARLVGRRDELIELADLEGIAEPLAALLLELPQREIGGALPSFEALRAQVQWARDRQIALHLDGARLWETAPFYGRSYGEIAALFDSVYVSFYKILGGIAGAVLAGPEAFIAEAKVWQRRQGGNLISMYPFVLSARAGMKERLSKMTAYRDRAVSVAGVLSALPGVRVSPDPPQVNMMHAFLPVEGEALLDASAAVARETRVALFTHARSCDTPGYTAVELSMGDAAFAIDDDELAALAADVLARAS